MIVGIYAFKDNINGFSNIGIQTSDLAAVRYFKFLCSAPGDFMNFIKEDLSLYKLADFDTESGDLAVMEPELVYKGADFIE